MALTDWFFEGDTGFTVRKKLSFASYLVRVK